jgi:copper chaperone NosL
MRMIKAEMFPEFGYLGILIGIFIVVGLVAALTGTRRWLMAFTSMAYVYGMAALYDFYRWGYDYGHNLDPHAAIRVPGMSYQPPLIGYKNLLNFTAYSGPDDGGWLIIGVGILATFLLVCSYFFCSKKMITEPGKTEKESQIATIAVGALLPLFLLNACSNGPDPIRFGQDNCAYCKMTCEDKRFGGEIVTKKGKVFKFDDLVCMSSYLGKGMIANDQIATQFAIDFAHPGSFVEVGRGFYLKNETIKSPMRGDVACFSSESDRNQLKNQSGGLAMTWNEAIQSFK